MKVKICGLTSPVEAGYLNENRGDFAGIVLFYPKSKRCVSIEQASSILAALNPGIKKTAVVVSPTAEQIRQIEALGFDYIQIHGRLPAALLSQIRIPVLKAFNVADMDGYETYSRCPQIAGYIFDAQEPGSGKVFDWHLVKQLPRDEKLLFLAGGLTPENVADAISAIHPDGVDVSSGVEYRDHPGKDPERIRRFMENARHLQ